MNPKLWAVVAVCVGVGLLVFGTPVGLPALAGPAIAGFWSVVTLLSPAACAQEPRGPRGGPRDPAASFQTTVVQGSVTQYLMNPDGYVDGLLLADNAIVRFPPHLGQVLTQTASPEDIVRVEGFFENPGILHASSIIDLQSQQLGRPWAS
jgi:hypothetical protein